MRSALGSLWRCEWNKLSSIIPNGPQAMTQDIQKRVLNESGNTWTCQERWGIVPVANQNLSNRSPDCCKMLLSDVCCVSTVKSHRENTSVDHQCFPLQRTGHEFKPVGPYYGFLHLFFDESQGHRFIATHHFTKVLNNIFYYASVWPPEKWSIHALRKVLVVPQCQLLAWSIFNLKISVNLQTSTCAWKCDLCVCVSQLQLSA